MFPFCGIFPAFLCQKKLPFYDALDKLLPIIHYILLTYILLKKFCPLHISSEATCVILGFSSSFFIQHLYLHCILITKLKIMGLTNMILNFCFENKQLRSKKRENVLYDIITINGNIPRVWNKIYLWFGTYGMCGRVLAKNRTGCQFLKNSCVAVFIHVRKSVCRNFGPANSYKWWMFL